MNLDKHQNLDGNTITSSSEQIPNFVTTEIDEFQRMSLHDAAKYNNYKIVKYLIATEDIDIDLRENDFTALHFASMEGNDRIVELLIDSGANCCLETKNGHSPLYLAAQGGHLSTAKLIASRTSNVNELTEYNSTILFKAVRENNLKAVETLLECSVDVNKTDSNGRTCLHNAIINGNEKIISLLLKYGSYVLQLDKEQKTVLDLVIEKGSTSIFKIILDLWVDANTKGFQFSRQVYQKVLNQNKLEFLTLMLEKNINNNGVTLVQTNLLNDVVKQNLNTVLKTILKFATKTDINTYNENGDTPLHTAIGNQNMYAVNLLLDHGADVNFPNENSLTALHEAANRHDFRLLRRLLETGRAKVNLKDNRGRTAMEFLLRIALIRIEFPCNHSNYVIDCLIDYGADVRRLLCDIGLDLCPRRNAVFRYFIRRTVAGFEVPFNLNLEPNATEQTYYEHCLIEIQKLITTKIYKHITYYDFLRASKKRLISFAKINEIQTAFSKKYHRSFSIYGDMLDFNYRVGNWNKLLEEVTNKFSNILANRLPILVIDKVLELLDENDMRNILEV